MEEKICHQEKFWIVKVTYAQTTLAYLVGLLHIKFVLIRYLLITMLMFGIF